MLLLAIIGLAQADDMNHRSPAGEDKDMQTRTDETDANLPQLAVVVTIVSHDQGSPEIEMFGGGEIHPMLFSVGFALAFIPGKTFEREKSRRARYTISVATINNGVNLS